MQGVLSSEFELGLFSLASFTKQYERCPIQFQPILFSQFRNNWVQGFCQTDRQTESQIFDAVHMWLSVFSHYEICSLPTHFACRGIISSKELEDFQQLDSSKKTFFSFNVETFICLRLVWSFREVLCPSFVSAVLYCIKQ